MKRSHALVLSGAAFFSVFSSPSFAQTIGSGMQCVPDVANASMYHNCHLRIVAGEEVCRCAIRPQALRRTDHIRDQDQDDIATGSINRGTILRDSQFGERALGSGASVGGRSLSVGTNGNVAVSGTAGGRATGFSSGGAVADNDGTVGSGTANNAAGGNFGGNGGLADGGTSNGGDTDNGGGRGNNGYGNGGGDGSPNGKDDTSR